MDTKARPVRQRRRKFNEERCLVVKEETQKMLNAGHIKEIQYPEWLANIVLVKKANGKGRMCVDFTDLNKACPKDSYPLPNIDTLVDSASGCKMLSFLDAFSGYNQIKMHPRDERKTTFMTDTFSYCYKVILPVDQNARVLPCQRYLPLDRLCTTLASVLHTSIHLKNLQKTEWCRCGQSRSDAQVSDGTTKTLREKS